MLYLKIFFILLLYKIFVHSGFIQDKIFDGIEMHFDRLDTTCGGKNTPFQNILQGVKTTSTKIFIRNITAIVKEGGLKKLYFAIVINRCRSKENLDTCEQFLKQDKIDFCKAIDPDNPFVANSPFYVPFEPPIKCPISKGIYRVYNVTIDIAPLFVFPYYDGWYWRVKNELVSEQNKLLFCVFLDAYFTNSKSKKHF